MPVHSLGADLRKFQHGKQNTSNVSKYKIRPMYQTTAAFVRIFGRQSTVSENRSKMRQLEPPARSSSLKPRGWETSDRKGLGWFIRVTNQTVTALKTASRDF